MKTKSGVGALTLIAAVLVSSPFWPPMETSAHDHANGRFRRPARALGHGRARRRVR